MSSTDLYVYNKSLEEDSNTFIMENRQYLLVPDTNGMSYPSGSVSFDCSTVSNSGKLIDWGNSFMEIPMTVVVSGLTDGLDAQNVYAITMKNYSHLISSMSVNISNFDCVTLSNYSNLDIEFKLLSTFSENDVATLGASIGFQKDNALSVEKTAGTSAIGVGEYNNVINDDVFNPHYTHGDQVYWSVNRARIERAKDTSFVADNSYLSTASATAVRKNRVVLSATTITYNILAVLRLRDLHDIFAKMPLVRGAYLRLTFNTNCNASVALTISDTGTTYSAFAPSSQHNTIPFQISPLGVSGAGTSTGLTKLDANGTINVVSSIASQCGLRICAYNLSPLVESQYFSNPNKKVFYNDLMSFIIPSTSSGGQINQIISNGISRIRSLLIVPQLAPSANGGSNQSPMNSPFSSSPSTTCPYAYMSNFNVLISGQAHYQTNILYGYETFMEEIRQAGSINNGYMNGLSSGLISYPEWCAGFHFMYVDLSRKSGQAQDNVSKSIQIVGTNASSVAVEYYVIVNYQREIEINTSTGALVF